MHSLAPIFLEDNPESGTNSNKTTPKREPGEPYSRTGVKVNEKPQVHGPTVAIRCWCGYYEGTPCGGPLILRHTDLRNQHTQLALLVLLPQAPGKELLARDWEFCRREIIEVDRGGGGGQNVKRTAVSETPVRDCWLERGQVLMISLIAGYTCSPKKVICCEVP